MDYDVLTKKYLRYSIWFLKTGSVLHEKETADIQKRVELEISKGLPMEAAYIKVLRAMNPVAHPDQEDAWQAEDIIKRGGTSSWLLLKNIIDAAPNDAQLLSYIGAGPFENWISKEENLNNYRNDLFAAIQSDLKWKMVAESSWHNPPELTSFLDKLKQGKLGA